MAIYTFKGMTPRIASGVFVAPNATIIGDTEVGEGSSIWFGVTIRGDVAPIKIGARTNIQDNSVIHVTNGKASTTIGDDVTVGHLALLHGCTIGNHCLVGMGSIVLDNAVIEDECFIAAGSLVSPGARIPSRSLAIGRPARVIRKLEERDLDDIRAAAVAYVEYASSFNRELVLT